MTADIPEVHAPSASALGSVPRCAIVRLRVHCFRNYAEATVRFGPGLNIIHGQNAQGKTNLLEAIATLALTRSPRTTSMADLLLWGRDAALAEAEVARPPANVTLAARFQRDPASGRVTRTAVIDGKPRSARSVLGVCPVVLFWPEDLALVRGGPEGRRRFLDVILAQTDPHAAAHMSRYRRVLEQRNALLHQVRTGGGGRDALNGFTSELATHGAWLAQARSRLVVALAPLAAVALQDLSGQRERITLRYAPAHDAAIPDDIAGAEQALLELAARARGGGNRTRDHTGRTAPGRRRRRPRRTRRTRLGVARTAAQHRARIQAGRGSLPAGQGGGRAGHPSR